MRSPTLTEFRDYLLGNTWGKIFVHSCGQTLKRQLGYPWSHSSKIHCKIEQVYAVCLTCNVTIGNRPRQSVLNEVQITNG